VVAVTLGLALGCGGKYDVGSGETGGQAGAGGAGETGSGGSSTSGRGGAPEQGGASTSGGTASGAAGVAAGGAPSGGTSAGGTSAGGASAGTGGSGGASGTQCSYPASALATYKPASPDVIWDRLCRFLYGGTRAPLEPLPETTTGDWVRERVLAILAEQYAEDRRAPQGLESFVSRWAFGGNDEADVEPWASAFARPDGNFADLFAREGDRVSFMSSRDFLLTHERSTKRGVWMLRGLLCIDVEPKPIDVEPVPAMPGQTSREALEASVADGVCRGCHSMIDPLGFSLEHYDSLGDYRTVENGRPIDASGSFDGSSRLEFSSIDDLAPQFVTYCEAQTCFAKTLLDHALVAARGAPAEYADGELGYVIGQFRNNALAMAPLLQAIATTPAFLRE
jgi:hypothetical protein